MPVKITGINKLFRLAKFEKGTLVREIDLAWNPTHASILLMHSKLVKFGWTYDDEIRALG